MAFHASVITILCASCLMRSNSLFLKRKKFQLAVIHLMHASTLSTAKCAVHKIMPHPHLYLHSSLSTTYPIVFLECECFSLIILKKGLLRVNCNLFRIRMEGSVLKFFFLNIQFALSSMVATQSVAM